MQTSITIAGREYALVKEQRNGLSVYKDAHSYLRIGAPMRVEKDISSHTTMARAGFPVSRILSSGLLDGSAYFIEESLGDKTFRTLFEEDIVVGGCISDQRFTEFLAITRRSLLSQLDARVDADAEQFARLVHLDILREELPQYSISLRDKFYRVLKKVEGFPFVLSHGDFNPANMLPRGIIDLEDAGPAPFGFDAISALSTIEWIPESPEFEFYAHYRFSAAQKLAYLALCDELAASAQLSPPSAYYDDFVFFRAMWSATNMQKWPLVQKWRYEKFIKTYLFS